MLDIKKSGAFVISGSALLCGLMTKILSKQILKSIHSTSSEMVDDMITMYELEEYSILRNLYLRYQKKKIYV
jgi:myosin heavy subunit